MNIIDRLLVIWGTIIITISSLIFVFLLFKLKKIKSDNFTPRNYEYIFHNYLILSVFLFPFLFYFIPILFLSDKISSLLNHTHIILAYYVALLFLFIINTFLHKHCMHQIIKLFIKDKRNVIIFHKFIEQIRFSRLEYVWRWIFLLGVVSVVSETLLKTFPSFMWDSLFNSFDAFAPKILVVIFITILTYILTELIHKIVNTDKSITDSISLFNKSRIKINDDTTDLQDNISKISIKFDKLKQDIENYITILEKETDVLNHFQIIKEKIKSEKDLENAFNTFRNNISDVVKNFSEQVIKKKPQEILSYFSVINGYLKREKKLFNNKENALHTTFSTYAESCRNLMTDFNNNFRSINFEYHTLLVLDPFSFFNNINREKCDSNWLQYLNFLYKSEIKINRYFLTKNIEGTPSVNGIKITSSTDFDSILEGNKNINGLWGMILVYKETEVPVILDEQNNEFLFLNRESDDIDENKFFRFIFKKNGIDYDVYEKRIKDDVRTEFKKIGCVIKKFHKTKIRKFVIDSREKLNKFTNDDSSKNISIDFFTLKQKEKDWLLCLGANLADYNKQLAEIKLHSSFTNNEEWNNIKQDINFIIEKSIEIP